MSKTITLADIAKKSRVSVSTVSLVLRDKPGIPVETRKRVIAAAEALGYPPKRQPPVSAGQPAAKRLSTVGLVLKADDDHPARANPFYSHVIVGIEQACRSEHINMLFATLPVDTDNVPTEVPRLLEEDEVDGILLVGAFVVPGFETVLRRKQVPVVLVDSYATSNIYDSVLTDNTRGTHQAVSLLVERGHKQIAFVGAHPHAYPSWQERRNAYASTLLDYGITDRYYADVIFRQEMDVAVKKLLTENPQVTACVCVNDARAIKAMKVAQALGRRVPDDLSIIGFDDIDLAANVMPALTTMHVDKVGMGRLAVQLLADRVQFPDSERITTLLQPRLVERSSVSGPAVR